MIKTFKLFEQLEDKLKILVLNKELMNILIDDIYDISSRESDNNDHWKRRKFQQIYLIL